MASVDTKPYMLKITIVQPLITSYRIPVYEDLSTKVDLTLLSSSADPKRGFGQFQVKDKGFRHKLLRTFRPFGEKVFLYQAGIAHHVLMERPDAVIVFANLRYLSFWTTVVLCRLLGVRVYAHGHGIYKKPTPGAAWRIAYGLLGRLLTRYICYTESVATSLRAIGFPVQRLAVAENSLRNTQVVEPDEKTGREKGLLFIGRLREGCGLEMLVEAVTSLRASGIRDIELHVIGGGEHLAAYRACWAALPWVVLHGEIFDDKGIADVSRQCFAGCYPGDAGLSIVHLMSMSLPPITHDDLASHGPEPSYIENGVNGILYAKSGEGLSLAAAIAQLSDFPARRAQMQRASFDTYAKLSVPSLGQRIYRILQASLSEAT